MARVHPVYKKITHIKKVFDQIANHAKISAPLEQMLTHICLGQNSKNLLFNNRDIYNKRQWIRKCNLDTLTLIQVLIHTLLDTNNLFVRYYPNLEPIQCLFFASQLSKWSLEISWNIILIDSICKTNYY